LGHSESRGPFIVESFASPLLDDEATIIPDKHC